MLLFIFRAVEWGNDMITGSTFSAFIQQILNFQAPLLSTSDVLDVVLRAEHTVTERGVPVIMELTF